MASISVGRQGPLPEPEQTLDKYFEELLADGSQINLDDKIGVIDLNKKMSFGELNAQANQIGRFLINELQSGCEEEERPTLVAVRFEPDVDLIITLFGILKAGMAYLPIAPDWPKSRIAYLVSDAQPIFVITNMEGSDDDFPPNMRLLNFHTMKERSLYFSESNLELERNTRTENIFAVMYTSGSTGRPKGVKLLHRRAFMRLHWQWEMLPFSKTKEEICAFKAALTFIDSVTEIFSALLSGHTLVVFPRDVVKNVHKFIQMLNQHQVTRLFLIPSLMKNMISYMHMEQTSLPDLTHWESTGELLTMETAHSFFNFFHHQLGQKATVLCNIYGGTEMMDNICETFQNWDQVVEKSMAGLHPSMGIAVPNSVVYIMDPNQKVVPLGETGEIWIAGQGLAAGYIGSHSHLNAFQDNDNIPLGLDHSQYSRLYRTGDFGRIVDGRIYYEGRQDMQVKVRGQRVNLVEIEATLRSMEEQISEAVVLVAKRGEPQQTILAFCQPNNASKKCFAKLKKEIEEKCRQTMPASNVPKIIILDSDYPRLVNGKVDRQELVRSFEADLTKVEYDYSNEELFGLKSDIARKILSTIGSVLGLLTEEKPKLAENFFSIGGNSINAVFAVSKLNDLGLRISLEQFIKAGTLLEVVEAVCQGEQLEKLTDHQESFFKIRPLKLEDRNQVLKIFADTYHSLEVMGQTMDLSFEECFGFGEAFWNGVEEEIHLSLVATDTTDSVLAVMFGGDHHKPSLHQLNFSQKVQVIEEFVFSNELRVVHSLFPEKKHLPGI